MNNQIHRIEHQPARPLDIERDWTGGHEKIVIEGVLYDAEYFRTFAHPETDVLYAVRRDGEQVVLTVIRSEEEAKRFFEEIGQGDPATTTEVDDAL